MTNPIYLPCGGKAYFDIESSISYRCEHCLAVVGSTGQSKSCKDVAEKWEIVKTLGGNGWDYEKGEPK